MKNLSSSSDSPAPSRRKRPGCLKVLAVLLILVFLLLTVAHFLAPSVGTNVANSKLPGLLNTDASLEGLHLNLLTGSAGLRGLTIQQPGGFEGGPLLDLKTLRVNAPPAKAASMDPLVVNHVRLEDMSVRLIQDTNQVLNATKLGPETAAQEPEAESEPAPPPPVWVKQILLEDIQLIFEDQALEWNIQLDDIDLEIEDLTVVENHAGGPARIEGSMTFAGPKGDGRLKVIGKLGTLDPANPDVIPTLQLALAVVGFDLDLVSPFLKPSPAVAKTTLGGTGLDFIVFATVKPGETPDSQDIDGRFALVMDGGAVTRGDLGGTVAEPALPFMGLFADVLGNQFGRITKLGGNIAQGGLEAGKTVAKTGVAAAKGAADTVTGFAGGILKTAKGVVTLDKDEAMGGMKDATVGTVGKAAGTVGKTAGTAAQGVGDTAKTVTGGDDREKWWEQIDQRLEAFETEAEAWFAENPFPENGS